MASSRASRVFKAGLVGRPVAHSLSPRIFGLLGRRLRVTARYQSRAVADGDLGRTLFELGGEGLAGVNVTIPHKRRVMRFLNALTPEAAAVGAVNAVRFSGRRLKGHNTDAAGFLDALALAGINPRGRDAVVFGAGGAARAVGWALGRAGARRVRFCARRTGAARAVARRLNLLCEKTKFEAGGARDSWLWVNATPLGMKGFPSRSPAPAGLRCTAAYDLVYGRNTPFLKRARAAGANAEGGLSMLVFQALRAWEFWFGALPVKRETLARHIMERL